MPKKKAPKDLPLMIDSAQQTDMRITSNGNVVKSNSKLYTFYDYRDKVKKNAETSTAFYKPKINKKSKVKFDDEDSSDSESSSKYSKNNSIKLSPKKTQLMKNVNKIYIEEDSYDQSDNGEDYDQTFIPKGKKNLHLKESPEKEEVQILYVKNSIPEVSIIPNSSRKYLYQPTIKPLVMPAPTIFAKTPSLVQLAPMQQSIQALPFHSPIKYNTIKRNSAFK
ncbi:hypothetical protein BpHYR1_031059 [Brachionus plicatilis]|uniref:Uncharacterized protein n=1 Tax=Brachionus plicatilis TaxID=10195 RepID=A0A3M7RX67_BRAPC|nr:hypothetical protein BpHYR1_031059 [Brachionus plicatilis]